MKTQEIIRNGIMASLLIAGINIATSCDSCSRKEKTVETTTFSEGESADTTTTSTTDSTEAASGSTTGNSTRTAATPGSNATATGTKTGTASSGTKQGMTEQEITDKIENSSSTPRKANGQPVNSGGTSGSGMGTGTGSTGNNSKVTRPEDQKGN